MKRGQSALEYLVTYGWAILAIVIISGVLWYTGVFDPARFAGSKQCSGFSPFVCQDFKINTSGAVVLVLNNGAGGRVTGVNITSAQNGTCNPSATGPNSNTTCTAFVVNSGGAAGDSYDVQTITGTYTDARSGIAHTFSGQVRGKFE